MTISDLGRQVKTLHPGAYDSVDDAALGRAMKARFPGLYDSFRDDLDAATIPETPRTLRIQMQQLRDGLRRVVFVARGAKARINPEEYGAKRHRAPSGDFYYRPGKVSIKEIDASIHDHSLNELLGATHGGYGAPPKEDLKPPIKAVVSREPSGETVQGALSDVAHVPETVKAAEMITPPGGSVSIEDPAKEIANRIKFRKPKAGQKWPAPK